MYNEYFSETTIVTSMKAYYTSRQGFPNRKAFVDYGSKVGHGYYLVCMNVDLRKANKSSYEYGTYVLRKFIMGLIDEGYAVFHITGEKFNVLVQGDKVLDLKNTLDEVYEDFNIYYGIIMTKEYTPDNSAELIAEGIVKMYQDKAVKKKERVTEELVVRNTPPELQETTKRKFRCTTWYAVIELTVTKPEFKTVMIYVFPTEYKRPLATLKTIAVVDDMGEYRTYYDTGIELGVGGVQFSLSCRFDRQGLLNVAFFKASEKGEYKHEIYVHKGECIPANFGKRVGEGREIFPIRKNVHGFFDYILLNQKEDTIELNTEGTFQSAGITYGVYQDKEFIDLIPEQLNFPKI